MAKRIVLHAMVAFNNADGAHVRKMHGDFVDTDTDFAEGEFERLDAFDAFGEEGETETPAPDDSEMAHPSDEWTEAEWDAYTTAAKVKEIEDLLAEHPEFAQVISDAEERTHDPARKGVEAAVLNAIDQQPESE